MSEVKPKTYIALILDRSGSMKDTKNETIMGYNEQVQQIKQNAGTQDIFVSLITFTGEVYEHLLNVPADELVEASPESYNPDGATAYRDAIGYTIDRLQSTVKPDDNNAFLVIVISDGDDNVSKHFSKQALSQKVEDCQATKQWTFTLMGCSEQSLKQVARETAIPVSNMAVWKNDTAAGTRKSMTRSRKKMGEYLTARSVGSNKLDCFYSADASNLADFDDDSLAENVALDNLVTPFDAGMLNTGVTSVGHISNAADSVTIGNTLNVGPDMTVVSRATANSSIKADYFNVNKPVSWK